MFTHTLNTVTIIICTMYIHIKCASDIRVCVLMRNFEQIFYNPTVIANRYA